MLEERIMSRLHARFGDQGTGGAGNLPDTDGTAAGCLSRIEKS